MAGTLTIRLSEQDRDPLAAAARARGTGLSAYLRSVAEREARRLRRAAIRSEGERMVSYPDEHPEAQAEIESYATPLSPGISAYAGRSSHA